MKEQGKFSKAKKTAQMAAAGLVLFSGGWVARDRLGGDDGERRDMYEDVRRSSADNNNFPTDNGTEAPDQDILECEALELSDIEDVREGIEYYEQFYKNTSFSNNFMLEDIKDARRQVSSFIDYAHRFGAEGADCDVTHLQQMVILHELGALQEIYGHEKIEIDEESGNVFIEGLRTLSLNDAYDRVLLDQYGYHGVKLFDYPQSYSQRDFEDVKWLINEGPRVDVEDDMYPFGAPYGLLMMSRFAQEMERLEYPLPENITLSLYNPDDPGTGWYDGKNSIQLTHINETTGTQANVWVHELAHHISAISDEFGQGEFEKRVQAVTEELAGNGVDEIDPELSHVGWDSKTTNSIEDYAETFVTYFLDGEGFRWRLQRLRDQERPEYSLMKVKYEFARDAMGGKEYGSEGVEVAPEEGDIFRIRDAGERDFGVRLRSKPESEEANGLVINDDFVTILSGPISEHDEYMDMQSDFYLVQAENEDGSVSTGWVSEMWLGDLWIEAS